MPNSHVERKVINGELCDVYYDENGKAISFIWFVKWNPVTERLPEPMGR